MRTAEAGVYNRDGDLVRRVLMVETEPNRWEFVERVVVGADDSYCVAVRLDDGAPIILRPQSDQLLGAIANLRFERLLDDGDEPA